MFTNEAEKHFKNIFFAMNYFYFLVAVCFILFSHLLCKQFSIVVDRLCISKHYACTRTCGRWLQDYLLGTGRGPVVGRAFNGKMPGKSLNTVPTTNLPALLCARWKLYTETAVCVLQMICTCNYHYLVA